MLGDGVYFTRASDAPLPIVSFDSHRRRTASRLAVRRPKQPNFAKDVALGREREANAQLRRALRERGDTIDSLRRQARAGGARPILPALAAAPPPRPLGEPSPSPPPPLLLTHDASAPASASASEVEGLRREVASLRARLEGREAAAASASADRASDRGVVAKALSATVRADQLESALVALFPPVVGGAAPADAGAAEGAACDQLMEQISVFMRATAGAPEPDDGAADRPGLNFCSPDHPFCGVRVMTDGRPEAGEVALVRADGTLVVRFADGAIVEGVQPAAVRRCPPAPTEPVEAPA